MDITSTTNDKWTLAENEKAAKAGYVLWVKPGKFGQLHCPEKDATVGRSCMPNASLAGQYGLNRQGGGRSGMEPKTDALTGCQYLSAPGGGLTPRLDGQGKQIGCRI